MQEQFSVVIIGLHSDVTALSFVLIPPQVDFIGFFLFFFLCSLD